jgi:hypothetical protein
MLNTVGSLKKEWRLQVLIVLFILLSVWWVVSPQMTRPYDEGFDFQFANLYFVVPLFSAVCGLVAVRSLSWKTHLGKCVLFFSVGLLGQAFGQLSYAYEAIVHGIEIPYPSVGDIGYFTSVLFYISGVIYLARAVNLKVWLESYENKFQATIIPIVMLVVAYGLFLKGYVFDWSQPLTIFLDFGYPLGQAVNISIGILTYLAAQRSESGHTRVTVFVVLLALSIQFFADYTFIYEASRGIWQVGGVNDYMYLVAYFVMGVGVMHLLGMSGSLH